MKKISSNTSTFIGKKLYPLLWFGPLAFLVWQLLKVSADKDLVLLVFPPLMAVIGFFLMKKLVWDLTDEVYDCGDFLLIKKGDEEERVALSNIMHVSGPSFTSRSSRIILSLVKPGKFGKEISFFPVAKFNLNPFAKNQVAEDLIVRVDPVYRRSTMDQSKPLTPEEKKGVKKIRWKYYGILILMLLAVPVCGFAHSLTHSDTVAEILGFTFFIAIFCIAFSIPFSRCPRCGTLLAKSFTITYKCRNCGLRI